MQMQSKMHFVGMTSLPLDTETNFSCYEDSVLELNLLLLNLLLMVLRPLSPLEKTLGAPVYSAGVAAIYNND